MVRVAIPPPPTKYAQPSAQPKVLGVARAAIKPPPTRYGKETELARRSPIAKSGIPESVQQKTVAPTPHRPAPLPNPIRGRQPVVPIRAAEARGNGPVAFQVDAAPLLGKTGQGSRTKPPGHVASSAGLSIQPRMAGPRPSGAPKTPAGLRSYTAVIQKFSPTCSGDDGNGRYYFKIKEIWYWLEQEVFKIYEIVLKEALKQRRQSVKLTSGTSPFGAMEMMDMEDKPSTETTYEIDSLKDTLVYAARAEADQAPRPLKFVSGNKEFTNHYNKRWASKEVYIDTKPSKYVDVAGKIGSKVGGDATKQARTFRRLLKGYKLESSDTTVVPSVHLERAAMIWSVSEASRNPANLAHLLIVLHLVKKGLITWDDAVSAVHPQRYVPSVPNDNVSKDLQRLRQAMINKLVNNTKIPADLKLVSEPFRVNLGQFLESASKAYKEEVSVSKKYPGELIVGGTDEGDAWGNIAVILENKILKHLR